MNESETLYDVKKMAEYLAVSVSTVRRLIRDEKIPCRTIGCSYRFLEADLLEYLESAEHPIKS
jgi:excisionase family DNA binding protein